MKNRPIHLLIVLSMLPLVSPAQTQEAPRSATRGQAAGEARTLFRAGSDEQAEKRLTDGNRNTKDTAEWHLESANELVQMAFSSARLGRAEEAVRIARRALTHAQQAARKASRPALAATAEETAAFIHEKLLADHASAKAAYQAAAQRHPQGGGAAKQLQRLERIEQEASRKAAARNR
jgi:hypothetical protein